MKQLFTWMMIFAFSFAIIGCDSGEEAAPADGGAATPAAGDDHDAAGDEDAPAGDEDAPAGGEEPAVDPEPTPEPEAE